MSPEIGKFLKIRNEINWRLAQLINVDEIEANGLEFFCQQLTDYLLLGAYTLGLPSDPFAEEFCKKYAHGLSNHKAFTQDLSKLMIILSERWNQEDRHIKQKLFAQQQVNH